MLNFVDYRHAAAQSWMPDDVTVFRSSYQQIYRAQILTGSPRGCECQHWWLIETFQAIPHSNFFACPRYLLNIFVAYLLTNYIAIPTSVNSDVIMQPVLTSCISQPEVCFALAADILVQSLGQLNPAWCTMTEKVSGGKEQARVCCWTLRSPKTWQSAALLCSG